MPDPFTIGSGGFGQVYHDKIRNVAVKKLKKPENKKDVEYFMKEAKTLQGLSHENIVQYKDFYLVSDANPPYFVLEMEFCERSSLRKVLDDPRIIYNMKTTVWWSRQLLSSLVYLIQVRLLHRDLKPPNVLVTKDFILKLCDFGLVRRTNTERSMTGGVGTSGYKSPEVDDKDGIVSPKSDLYSMAKIIYEILNRGLRLDSFQYRLLPIRHLDSESIDCEDQLLIIIKHCIELKPEDRPETAVVYDIIEQLNKENPIVSWIPKEDPENKRLYKPTEFDKYLKKRKDDSDSFDIPPAMTRTGGDDSKSLNIPPAMTISRGNKLTVAQIERQLTENLVSHRKNCLQIQDIINKLYSSHSFYTDTLARDGWASSLRILSSKDEYKDIIELLKERSSLIKKEVVEDWVFDLYIPPKWPQLLTEHLIQRMARRKIDHLESLIKQLISWNRQIEIDFFKMLKIYSYAIHYLRGGERPAYIMPDDCLHDPQLVLNRLQELKRQAFALEKLPLKVYKTNNGSFYFLLSKGTHLFVSTDFLDFLAGDGRFDEAGDYYPRDGNQFQLIYNPMIEYRFLNAEFLQSRLKAKLKTQTKEYESRIKQWSDFISSCPIEEPLFPFHTIQESLRLYSQTIDQDLVHYVFNMRIGPDEKWNIDLAITDEARDEYWRIWRGLSDFFLHYLFIPFNLARENEGSQYELRVRRLIDDLRNARLCSRYFLFFKLKRRYIEEAQQCKANIPLIYYPPNGGEHNVLYIDLQIREILIWPNYDSEFDFGSFLIVSFDKLMRMVSDVLDEIKGIPDRNRYGNEKNWRAELMQNVSRCFLDQSGNC